MTKLEELRELGFYVTWKLIDLGFKGSDVFRNELTARNIIDFAITMVSNEQDADDDVVGLACEYDANVDKINDYVVILARKENSEYTLEFRKWRSLYVLRHLPNKEKDHIEGLIELGDIWAYFDFPPDSPHVFQGQNNNITPELYYTKKNYNTILRKHIVWLNNEVKEIKKCQEDGSR